MKGKAAYRGQPLLMLAFVLGSWVILRAATWEQPFPRAFTRSVTQAADDALIAQTDLETAAFPGASPTVAALARLGQSALRAAGEPGPRPAGAAISRVMAAGATRYATPGRYVAWSDAGAFGSIFDPDPATFSHAPVAAAALEPAIPLQPAAPAASAIGSRRWSADAWLLLRRGETPAVASGASSYGASQFGAVLRYRLAPANPHRPTAYLRTTSALTGAREAEVAAGLALRPLARLPISTAAELRALRAGQRVIVRPAIYAVTELAPFELPLAFSGEAYAQAGYVGGEYATAFIDGQLRVDRKLAHVGPATVRAGGGAWGGAQKGASRLDVGPAATLGMKIGPVPSRLSLDWRFRVAGEAEPADGPALTLSAGF